MNQTKTTTSQEQLTKNLDLVLKERALQELTSINEEIQKYEGARSIDYQQLPYRHTHNCIFPNGEQEVNRVWHSCL